MPHPLFQYLGCLLYLLHALVKTKELTVIFVSTRHHVDYLHELLNTAGTQHLLQIFTKTHRFENNPDKLSCPTLIHCLLHVPMLGAQRLQSAYTFTIFLDPW